MKRQGYIWTVSFWLPFLKEWAFEEYDDIVDAWWAATRSGLHMPAIYHEPTELMVWS